MGHIFFIFAIVSTFSNADYLNTKSSNACVYDVEPYQGHTGLCYTKRSNNNSYCSTTLKFEDLIDGYVRWNGGCYLKNDLELTGLTQNQWNYLMAILANILGFTMLFLINYIAILIVKK